MIINESDLAAKLKIWFDNNPKTVLNKEFFKKNPIAKVLMAELKEWNRWKHAARGKPFSKRDDTDEYLFD